MRRLQRTIEEIGWSRDVPRLAHTARVASAFDLMSREQHDCVLVTAATRSPEFHEPRPSYRVARARRHRAVTLADMMTQSPRARRLRESCRDQLRAVEGFRNVRSSTITADAGVLRCGRDAPPHDFFDEIESTQRQARRDRSSPVSRSTSAGDQ